MAAEALVETLVSWLSLALMLLVIVAPVIALAMAVQAWRRPYHREIWLFCALLVGVAYLWLEGPRVTSFVWDVARLWWSR